MISSPFLVLWIGYCVWAILSGWTLSLEGMLNKGGYAIALLVGIGITLIIVSKLRASGLFFKARFFLFSKWSWRIRHSLPALYLLLVFLVLLGTLIYAPSQYDALCYRVPRMFHWLSESRWHWIHAGDERMNLSAVGMEWITMPLLALTHSSRWLWIPNFISLLLLPGLTFGLFRSLGFSGRAAWAWMWILPTGFCFATQAGSIGNDLIAVPISMASVWFAVRATRRQSFFDLSLAILSSALLTGIKASNIPLVLPAVIAALPCLRLLLKHPFASAVVIIIGLCVSFAPMAALNQVHTGVWTGSRDNKDKLQLTSPVAGLLGNGTMIALAWIQPPVLPAGTFFHPITQKILGANGLALLETEFPRCNLNLGEIPMEESAGLGLGVLLVLLGGIAMQFGASQSLAPVKTLAVLVLLAAWAALGVYMLKLGSESAARLLQPYYPFIIAGLWLLFVRRQSVVRLPAWRGLAIIAMLMTLAVVVIIPARPLWPALTCFNHLGHSSPAIKRAEAVYQTYRNRPYALSPVRKALPEGTTILALANGGGDLEGTLWEGWNGKITNLLPGDTAQGLRAQGVQAICISDRTLQDPWKMTSQEFAHYFEGTIVAMPRATQVIGWGEQTWYVVKLLP